MKRLLLVGVVAMGAAGCASEEMDTTAAPAPEQPMRLGAGDSLGWRLQAHDRAITSVNAEERDLAEHE